MADCAGDFEAETECRKRLHAPARDRFCVWRRIKRGVALDGCQTPTIEPQKLALWRARREELADPLFVSPHRAANVEHALLSLLAVLYRAIWQRARGGSDVSALSLCVLGNSV